MNNTNFDGVFMVFTTCDTVDIRGFPNFLNRIQFDGFVNFTIQSEKSGAQSFGDLRDVNVVASPFFELYITVEAGENYGEGARI